MLQIGKTKKIDTEAQDKKPEGLTAGYDANKSAHEVNWESDGLIVIS